MYKVSGNGYARTGDDNSEWPTYTFTVDVIKPHFAIVYRDTPIKGLRTFPQRKNRRHKKEHKKRTANIIGEVDFNSKEPTHTLTMGSDGLLHLD